VIYLASPYTHADPAVMEARFDAVCRAAGALMAAGEMVYSPIAHTHPIAIRCALPRDFAFWEAFDKRMISACDSLTVLKLDGWTESHGVKSEMDIAFRLGIPIAYLEPSREPQDESARSRPAGAGLQS